MPKYLGKPILPLNIARVSEMMSSGTDSNFVDVRILPVEIKVSSEQALRYLAFWIEAPDDVCSSDGTRECYEAGDPTHRKALLRVSGSDILDLSPNSIEKRRRSRCAEGSPRPCVSVSDENWRLWAGRFVVWWCIRCF